ncbi:MAG: hypothetical protein ACREIV_10020 [Planctomycetaceae bacterium]
MRPRLKLFTGTAFDELPEPRVSVRLGDVTRILADAVRAERTWLDDFEDEDIEVSADLYEVLSTYWHLRPSA